MKLLHRNKILYAMRRSSQKICFYIMRVDTGFAPNPFHGFCTLAACTPNHQRAKLEKGDLIAGCFRSGQPPQVVYVMEVDEVLSLDQYYRDARFAEKRPLRGKTWVVEAGDNIYFSKDGQLQQDPNANYHHVEDEPSVVQQDLKGNRVFIGKRFVYFGENAELLPEKYSSCLPGRGVKYLRDDPDSFEEFRTWAFNRPVLGLIGSPRDCNMHDRCQPTKLSPPVTCSQRSNQRPCG